MKSAMEMSESELKQFRIEHGIRIEDHPISYPDKGGKWIDLIKSMKKGDSIHLIEKQDRLCMMAAGVKLKIKLSSRMLKDRTFRVWRMV